MHHKRRILCAVVLGLSAAMVGTTQPAQAMNYTSAPLTRWTFVDSAQPTTPHIDPEGDVVPLGTDGDGVRRAYLTYDLTGYRDQVIHRAALWTDERSAADCTTAATVEVWRTEPVTSTTTWAQPPADLEPVATHRAGPGTSCPAAHFDTDVLAQVTAAIARQERSITFGVRIAGSAEREAAAGRTVKRATLSIRSNHPPVVSDPKLSDPPGPCGTLGDHPTATSDTRFAATVTDADRPTGPTAITLAFWPLDHPEQRTEVTGRNTFAGMRGFPDGTVLGWAAHAADDDDVGPWSETCYVTVDHTAPAQGPVVTSRTYNTKDHPGTGGPGVPGEFTFDAAGDRDVVAFGYRPRDGLETLVAARSPGGRACVTLTPRSWGSNVVEARSVDAAGNRGPWTRFEYWVRNTTPAVDVQMNGVGLTSHITVRSSLPSVTAFGWSVEGGPETRLPAGATGDLVFGSVGTSTVAVRLYEGHRPAGSYTETVRVTDAPAVGSDEFGPGRDIVSGQTGTFRLAPRAVGVAAYEYTLDDAPGRIGAATDGTAALPWTAPAGSGSHTLTVTSLTANGARSQPTTQTFWVISDRAEVFTDGGTGPDAGVGRPIDVFLSSDLPGVTGFAYRYDDDPEQTVAGSNRHITVTPKHAGGRPFTAWAIRADGSRTPATTVTITVTSAPLVSVAGPYGAEPVLGRDATFTLRPAVAEVTAYRYRAGAGRDEQTVAAGPDGTATITLVPGTIGSDVLEVTSVAADGTTSDPRGYTFSAVDPAVQVWGDWDEWSPGGAPGRAGYFHFQSRLFAHVATFRWSVDDGPVHEAAPGDEEALAPYTPDTAGEHTLHVQAVFSDGVLSPTTDYRFLVDG